MRLMILGGLRAVVVLLALALWPATAAAEATNDDLLAGWLNQLRHAADEITREMDGPRTTVPAGATLRIGSAGPRVAALVQRLGELGIVEPPDPAAAASARFDETVDEAVRRYQQASGLFVDGIVGPQTLAALNRSREDSLRALQWTIGEIETLRPHLPDVFLVVNIPSQTAMLIRDGSVSREIRVAVGRPDRQTPMMADEITQVVVNPTWTVPPTIMRNDVLPRLRSSGATGVSASSVYLHGMQVDPALIDWSLIEPWEIAIVQRPGNHNTLGRFRFTLTNGQAIFLHDTNARSVFGRAHRAVSSGCVRVEDAQSFAEWLVRPQGVTPADLTSRVNRGYTQVIELDQPLPVYLTYWTATVERDAGVVVHRDIYYRMDSFTIEMSEAEADIVGG